MLKNPGVIIDMGALGMGGTAQVIVPTLGALFWERSNSRAMAAGLTAGIALLCFLCFVCDLFTPYAAVLSLILNALIFIVLSFFLDVDPAVRASIAGHKKSFNQRNFQKKG